MPDIHETAYPCLKSSFSNKELYELYTPSSDDLALASEVTKGVGPKICFLILLKTFQRLGYFVFLQDVPKPIAEHISLLFGVHHGALEWAAYDESGSRRRHVSVIRDHLGVKPFKWISLTGHGILLWLVAQFLRDARSTPTINIGG